MIDDDSDCRGENDFSYTDSYHFAPMRLWFVVVIDDGRGDNDFSYNASYHFNTFCNQLGNQVEHLKINKGLP